MVDKTVLYLAGASFVLAVLYYYLIYKGYHKTIYDFKNSPQLREAYPVLF